MPSRLLYGIAALIVLSFLVSWSNKRKRAAAWQGVVESIRGLRPGGPAPSPDAWITVFYRTDTGSNGRFRLRHRFYRQFYPDLAVGDRLVKVAGRYLPDRQPADAPAEAPADAQAAA